MKIYSKKAAGLVLSGALLFASLNSCVKNRNDLATDFSTIKPVIEILSAPQNAATPVTFQAMSLDASAGPTQIKVYVHYSAPQPADRDIVVTLAIDQTTISTYNTDNGTNYQLLASNAFTVDNFKVTIKKGEYYGFMTLTINPAVVNLNLSNAIAFKVIDAEGLTISANFGATMYGLVVKNRWDGVYRITGTFVDLLNAAFVSKYPLQWDLVTVSGTTVTVYDNINLGFPGYLFSNAGASTYYGNFGLIVNLDPATNAITSVVNYYGQGTNPSGRSASLNPSGINAYDPVTKTIKIKYYLQAPGTTIRSTFDETWTYIGPRP